MLPPTATGDWLLSWPFVDPDTFLGDLLWLPVRPEQ